MSQMAVAHSRVTGQAFLNGRELGLEIRQIVQRYDQHEQQIHGVVTSERRLGPGEAQGRVVVEDFAGLTRQEYLAREWTETRHGWGSEIMIAATPMPVIQQMGTPTVQVNREDIEWAMDAIDNVKKERTRDDGEPSLSESWED